MNANNDKVNDDKNNGDDDDDDEHKLIITYLLYVPSTHTNTHRIRLFAASPYNNIFVITSCSSRERSVSKLNETTTITSHPSESICRLKIFIKRDRHLIVYEYKRPPPSDVMRKSREKNLFFVFSYFFVARLRILFAFSAVAKDWRTKALRNRMSEMKKFSDIADSNLTRNVPFCFSTFLYFAGWYCDRRRPLCIISVGRGAGGTRTFPCGIPKGCRKINWLRSVCLPKAQ